MKAFAPVLQFVSPSRAHKVLAGGWCMEAIGASAVLIVLGGMAAVTVSPLFSWEIPALILIERGFIAALGGTAAWGLARALGEKHRLLPGLQSAFMAMVVWVLLVAALLWLSRLTGISPGFSWSAVELARWLPGNLTGYFLFIVLVNLDLPSVVTVFIWGRGLSAAWGTNPSFGMRMAWAIYLFAIVLQAASALLGSRGSEVNGL